MQRSLSVLLRNALRIFGILQSTVKIPKTGIFREFQPVRTIVIGRDLQSGDTVMTVYNKAQAHPKYIVEYCITRPFPR